MIRVAFNGHWEVRPKVNPFAELAGASIPYRRCRCRTTVYDRAAAGPAGRRGQHGGGAGAYFPGGAFEYRKAVLRAGGTPRQADPHRVRGRLPGRDGATSTGTTPDSAPTGTRSSALTRRSCVSARTTRFASRRARTWTRAGTPGRGIYRDTWMLTGDLVRIEPEAEFRVTTPTPTPSGRSPRSRPRRERLHHRHTGRPASAPRSVTPRGTVVASWRRPKITVLPRANAPGHRPAAPVRPRTGDVEPGLTRPVHRPGDAGGRGRRHDAETVTFGIRSLRLDPDHGLRSTARPSSCAARASTTTTGCWARRPSPAPRNAASRFSRTAGFNAIRMSHHPASTAMLDACDRLGVLVVDEASDGGPRARATSTTA